MKLIYLSPLRYPSAKAGSIFSMKSAEAFAEQGIGVELWAPRRRNELKQSDPFTYSGVKKNFTIRRFPTIDLIGIIPGGFHLMSYTFAFSVFVYSLALKLRGTIDEYIFYSHEQFALLFLTYLSPATYYELHDFPSDKRIYKTLFRRICGTVSTNTWKAKEVIKKFGLNEKEVLTVPNAVDLKDFSSKMSVAEARAKLSLDPGDVLIGYVGALKTMGMEKGIAILIDALAKMPPHFKLYVIGGEKDDIWYYASYARQKGVEERVIFAGNVPHKNIELYTSACDMLVAPYPDTEHYRHYMSPMKVFEYMAAQRPMIVTDLPAVREIVDDTMAVFVRPDDAQVIAEAAEKLVGNKEYADNLARLARTKAESRFSWTTRAITILEYVKKSNN